MTFWQSVGWGFVLWCCLGVALVALISRIRPPRETRWTREADRKGGE